MAIVFFGSDPPVKCLKHQNKREHVVKIEVVELRYSLNGISESQLQLLFSNLDQLDSQVILKRLANTPTAISLDDFVLEGIFSSQLIEALSRAYTPPLSFKVQLNTNPYPVLKPYGSFEWREDPLLLCGVTLLPFNDIKSLVPYENPWQFLRLINTSEAATVLRPILVVKPKGLLAITSKTVEFILPMHRIDFLLVWLERVLQAPTDINWLSGSTGEVSPQLLQTVGSIQQEALPKLETQLSQTPTTPDLDFNQIFHRSLSCIEG